MKRIIVFLAGMLVIGSCGVAFGWSTGHGLTPAADHVARATPHPSASATPIRDSSNYRLPLRRTPTPLPTASATPAPAATPSTRPAPSTGPVSTVLPAPTPTPVPTPPRTGCGQCGGYVDQSPNSPIMCPMMTANYCIDATQ